MARKAFCLFFSDKNSCEERILSRDENSGEERILSSDENGGKESILSPDDNRGEEKNRYGRERTAFRWVINLHRAVLAIVAWGS